MSRRCTPASVVPRRRSAPRARPPPCSATAIRRRLPRRSPASTTPRSVPIFSAAAAERWLARLAALAVPAARAHAIEHARALGGRSFQPAPAQLLALPGRQARKGTVVLADQLLGFRVELLEALPAPSYQLAPLLR